jgi:hypothetical protein
LAAKSVEGFVAEPLGGVTNLNFAADGLVWTGEDD